MSWLVDGAKTLVRTQNAFLGYIFGNNPASVPCLHEMGWFGWSQSLFTTKDQRVFSALAKQLQFFARHAIDEIGFVKPRWGASGFYMVPWGPLQDQMPHFILCAQSLTMATGNKTMLRELEPALDTVAGYLAQHIGPDDVFLSPNASGLSDGQKHAGNWYDVVEFGHKDAYVNVWVILAMRAMSDIKLFLGHDTDPYGVLEKRLTQGFNKVFWSDEEGIYADWIDTEGTPRYYFFTDHNMLAAGMDIANVTQAESIMEKIDDAYNALYKQQNVTRLDVWATPCNMRPISRSGDRINSPGVKWPSYEDGQAFFHSVGFEALARGRVKPETGLVSPPSPFPSPFRSRNPHSPPSKPDPPGHRAISRPS